MNILPTVINQTRHRIYPKIENLTIQIRVTWDGAGLSKFRKYL